MKEQNLLYKPDASQACARMEAYWEKAILDRPPVLLTAPKPHPQPLPQKRHATLAERWMDVEFVVETGAATVANTYWAGDGLPVVWPNLGPEILTACFGAPLTFGESTSWSKPILHDLERHSGAHHRPEQPLPPDHPGDAAAVAGDGEGQVDHGADRHSSGGRPGSVLPRPAAALRRLDGRPRTGPCPDAPDLLGLFRLLQHAARR